MQLCLPQPPVPGKLHLRAQACVCPGNCSYTTDMCMQTLQIDPASTLSASAAPALPAHVLPQTAHYRKGHKTCTHTHAASQANAGPSTSDGSGISFRPEYSQGSSVDTPTLFPRSSTEISVGQPPRPPGQGPFMPASGPGYPAVLQSRSSNVHSASSAQVSLRTQKPRRPVCSHCDQLGQQGCACLPATNLCRACAHTPDSIMHNQQAELHSRFSA